MRALAFLALLVIVPASLAAQADSSLPGWIRFRTQPSFELREPPIVTSPWLAGPRPGPAAAGARWEASLARAVDSAQRALRTATRLRRLYGRRAVEAQDTVTRRDGVLGLSRRYADLNIDGQSRLEIRTERIKNHRCTAAQYLDLSSGCRSGGFKAPRLDTYLSMRAGGLIGQRLHVDVDYDTERDFNARNNLLIYYEGLENEIVRRVEVGTVTFRPPPSRYLTAAIPANNFGVNATVQVGALEVQALAATQEGSQIADRRYQVGTSAAQPQDREARDLDYEARRFFWVPDPATITGYPRLDVLNLAGVAPPAEAPLSTSALRVYRYRPASRAGTNPNLGGITAVALGADPTQRVTAQWELLVPNTDYYVDPSALWIGLTQRLDENEYLAVSYETPTGFVGTFPAQDTPVGAGQPPADTLRLIVEPRVANTRETFRHELRNIYVVAGGDLNLSTLKVGLTLNRSEKPLGNPAGTYLAAFGLATPNDPNTFNAADRLFPRNQDPTASLVLPEHYIVFPTLQPFGDGTILTPAERNDSVYATPGYLLLTEGPPAKFVFRLQYTTTSSGDMTTLDLGALQIRSGSDQLTYNGRRLERDIDYTINYDLGKVTFTNPRQLFGQQGGTVQARFEERGIFAVAPTQIYGLATRYALGDVGGINLVGVYQVEQSAFNRPQLGFEASAQLMGGITTDLRFRPEAVTRFLNRLTTTPSTAPSRLDVNAELALSRPDPNRSGQAYLESFEGDPGLPVSLRENAWQLGNVPRYTDGVDQVVGVVFDTADAVQLTWQNLISNGSNQLRAGDIDPQLQVAGQGNQLETILYLALHPDTSGGQTRRDNTLRWTLPARPNQPRWRSMTTPLSITGTDLTRNEFLEFWVYQNDSLSAEAAGVRLVLDLGEVGEDALAFAPDSATISGSDSLYRGRHATGVGRLDSEADPLLGTFNAASDDNGILGARPDSLVVNGSTVYDPSLCFLPSSGSVAVFPWGDLDARCSRGNGVLDAEDLDGDNRLDAAGPTDNTLRWVIDVRDTTKYFVRRGVTTTSGIGGWVLYRIPLRTPDATLGTPNVRLVKHLRLTVVGEPDQGGPDIKAQFALGRMRFLGSSWVRRSGRPVQGLAGSTANPTGEVLVTTVSTENVELGYTSPPGVRGGVDRRGGSRDEFGTVVNERSLRIVGTGLQLGDRAEGYLRFPSGSRNLLRYRELRLWARGRGAGWDNDDFRAYVRVGSDPRNFYQYSQPARTTTWNPEMQVSLEKWRELRAQLETRRLQGLPADSAQRVACGGDPLSIAYVACDGGYLVYVENPAVTPPNLAAVQEVAVGIYRAGTLDPSDSTEVWIDDLRLLEPISTVGTAMAVDARLVGSNVGDLSFSYTRRDGRFQQIGSEPTYQTQGTFTAGTALNADRFLPTALGVAVPVSVNYSRTAVAAELLGGTDVLRSDLRNVRQPRTDNLDWSIALRRTQRGKSWLVRGLLDPMSLSAAFSHGNATSELSQATTTSRNLAASYTLVPGPTRVSLGLGGLVDALPAFLRKTAAGDGLRTARVTLAPSSLRLSSGLVRSESELLSFSVPVVTALDTARVVNSLTHTWRNSAGVSWDPFGMLNLGADLASTRDLRQYPDSTALGRLARAERRSFLGMDVGVERDRSLTTTLGLTPRLTRWLRPRYITSSGFILSRSLTSRNPVREDGDSAGAFILPQTLNKTRTSEVGAAVDFFAIATALFGDSSAVTRASRRIRPFDIADRLTRTGTWDLAAFDPGLGFQLGLGGRDDYLVHEGEQAIAASEVKATTFGSGFDLPFGLTFNLSYQRTRSARYQRSAGAFFVTQSFQQEWPRGNARLVRTLRRGPVALVSVGANFRTASGRTETPSAGAPVVTAVYSRNLTPDLSLTFRNGMNLSGSLSKFFQTRDGNGRSTETSQNDLNLALSHSFPLPRSVSRMRKMVRGQVSTTRSKSVTCLNQAGVTSGCLTIQDTRREEYRASFDTDLLASMSGGLQFSYAVNEARHLNRKVSQLILTLAFQLSLYSGDYR